jgi:isocitrate/isopropylmalate dehydrogenase
MLAVVIRAAGVGNDVMEAAGLVLDALRLDAEYREGQARTRLMREYGTKVGGRCRSW